MQLSQGPYSYNRFDLFEKKLDPVGKEDADVDNDGDVDSSDGYLKNRREAIGKAMGKKGASNPQKMKKEVDEAGKKSKAEGKKLSKDDEKDEAKQEAETASESLNTQETGRTIMEHPQMALYSRALGRMGAGYPAANLYEKESTAERKEAADRADEEKRQKKEGKKGEAHETKEIEKLEDKKLSKEEVIIDKDMVLQYLIDENFVNNEVSAEAMFNHISDDFLANIEEMMTNDILSEGGPAYPVETKAQAKAQADHRKGKSSAGLKTGKNPGTEKGSGYNRQD